MITALLVTFALVFSYLLGGAHATIKRRRLIFMLTIDSTKIHTVGVSGQDAEGQPAKFTDLEVTAEATSGTFGEITEVTEDSFKFNPAAAGDTGVIRATAKGADGNTITGEVEVTLEAGAPTALAISLTPDA